MKRSDAEEKGLLLFLPLRNSTFCLSSGRLGRAKRSGAPSIAGPSAPLHFPPPRSEVVLRNALVGEA